MAVGQNVLRKEGYEKLTGAARYIDDITLDGMMYGKTIRATDCARAHQIRLVRREL